MTKVGEPGAKRYRAFISYSHRDDAFAARLHRRLEGYRLPRRLGAAGGLTPIFKDREEFPAADDLGAQVTTALSMSEALIVVCSPDAAASPWVGKEIEAFRRLRPDRPVLAALIRGEPSEAFPPALAAGGLEPLAADFRKQGDGDRLALLKLVAGLAGVGVDELVQRDAQRRLRGVMAVATVAIAGMLAMSATTFVAVSARAEAERQRGAAEKLVQFILTDLREGLKGVGSLPVQTKVNQRALDYYGQQDQATLRVASRLRWAQLLHGIGEDDVGRGDLDSAAARFEAAYRVSAKAMADEPDDADVVWTHAQSVYWRGFLAYSGKRTGSAKLSWSEYGGLARRLQSLEPDSLRTLEELAYADTALCSLAVTQERDQAAALRFCQAGLEGMRRVAARAPADATVIFDLATNEAWMADALMLSGDRRGARSHRLAQVALLDRLLGAEPDNAKVLDSWATSHRALGRIAFHEKDYSAARRHYGRMLEIFQPLQRRDPTNALWGRQATEASRSLAVVHDYERKEMAR